MNSDLSEKTGRLGRFAGIILLFLVIGFAFYLHVPTLKAGYLNAGDDHIHVAFANELARIWQDEGHVFGWSRLYGAGAPIFILRPPGLYFAIALTHFLSGISVEQALKMVVLFGFCLYPLSIFIGGRLLGIGFWAAVFSGMLAILPISLWGHTIDAYQYLGVHKQLLAILFFPVAVGALWRLLKDGRHGALFAASFAAMFLTHPYIAYCFALLVPGMFLALVCQDPCWRWRQGIGWTILWSIPALLFICVWLVPFVSSGEIQVIDPFLSRRKAFDVIASTTTETFRQYFLGGILDTTRFAGPFGGTSWVDGNEWGWLRNDTTFRLPVLTGLSFLGLLGVVFQPQKAAQGFLGLGFLIGLLLFIGPDDFPFLDAIPFAKKFQNVHAIFLFEWAAIMLAGVACQGIFRTVGRLPGRWGRYAAFVLVAAALGGAYGTGLYERSKTAGWMIDVRNIYTENGNMSMRPGIHHEWKSFNNIVKILKSSSEPGNISAMPYAHDDSVLYNLLPLMVNRPVFISGFEMVGGVYSLVLYNFRSNLQENSRLQRLFNIRYVINSPLHRRSTISANDSLTPLVNDQLYELFKVSGEFGELEALAANFVGFTGSEREWSELMVEWLRAFSRGSEPPFIINLSSPDMGPEDLVRIQPFISLVLLGKDSSLPPVLAGIKTQEIAGLAADAVALLPRETTAGVVEGFSYEPVLDGRKEELFRVSGAEHLQPVLFKRAYYRGWQAAVDRDNTTVYRVSPGLQLVLVPPGNHELSWQYTGPVYWPWARGAFLLGAAMAVLLVVAGKRRKVTALLQAAASPVNPGRIRRLAHYLPSVAWLVFAGVFCQQAVSEAIFKVPVIILPVAGQTVTGEMDDFYWNNVVGIPRQEQQFRFEAAADPDFVEIIKAETVSTGHARFYNSFQEPGPYYYRVRLETAGKQFRWSKPVMFYGAGGKRDQ